jgi:hypothetical protein
MGSVPQAAAECPLPIVRPLSPRLPAAAMQLARDAFENLVLVEMHQ